MEILLKKKNYFLKVKTKKIKKTKRKLKIIEMK